jgi:hypothetical protein
MAAKKKKQVYGTKSKGTAVVLAVLLAHWTWIYTYREDAYKFWIGLLLSVLLWWTFVVPLGIWIWAIVDAAGRHQEWYECYQEG